MLRPGGVAREQAEGVGRRGGRGARCAEQQRPSTLPSSAMGAPEPFRRGRAARVPIWASTRRHTSQFDLQRHGREPTTLVASEHNSRYITDNNWLHEDLLVDEHKVGQNLAAVLLYCAILRAAA